MSRRVNQRVKANRKPTTIGEVVSEPIWRKARKLTFRCGCGQTKKQRWHLACDACWALVPAPLQSKVYRLFKQQQGSEAHREAVRECYAAISARRVQPQSPTTPKEGHNHAQPGGESPSDAAGPIPAAHQSSTPEPTNNTDKP